MQLLVGYNALVNDFIRQHGGGFAHPSLSQTFASLHPDKGIIAGISFHTQNSRNVIGNIAVVGSHLPKNLLIAALRYGFADLKCQRLTFFVAASNLRSINFVEKLGAYREATLQDGCDDGDLYVYCLRPSKCPIWRIANGEKFRKCSEST